MQIVTPEQQSESAALTAAVMTVRPPSGATMVARPPPMQGTEWERAIDRRKMVSSATRSAADDFEAGHAEAGETRVAEMITASLKYLVEHGATPAARALLAVARRLQPAVADALEHWASVLTLPTARHCESATGRSTADNYRWLDQNRAAQAGRWAALRDGHLVDVDDDQLVLYQRLKSTGQLSEVLFVKVPQP